MKGFFLVATLFVAIIGVNAQEIEKISIGILPTTLSDGKRYEETVLVDQYLSQGFHKTNRFEVVDRSKMDALQQERNLQKTEDFMDGAVISQSKSLGAQYLVSSVMSNYVNEGDVAKFMLNISILDVETGKVVANESIQPKSGGFGKKLLAIGTSVALGSDVTLTSKEKALEKALEKIVPEIDKFVAKNFPVSFSIIEFQNGNKKVLISGGSSAGVKNKMKLKVIEEVPTKVGGKTIKRKKEVGQLVVEKVEDENFSICLIKSGEGELVEKFNNGVKLLVNFEL